MNTFASRTGVVVGLDDSAPVSAAVGWAVEYARGHHLPLRVVAAGRSGGAAERRRELLDLTVLLCRSTALGLPVSGCVAEGEMPAALIEAAHGPEILVVGGRENVPVERILAAASCPVVVVRSARWPNPASPVVVGLDGSDADDAPLSLAFDVAAHTVAPLVAVHARCEPVHRGVTPEATVERLRSWGEKYPRVSVRCTDAHDRAVPAILADAKVAGLVVVGPAGPGGIVRHLVHEAACPVLVACGAPELVGARS
ncbi:hypothetical protein [Cryptosporangium sp. NPDC051539]|uniref:hypothetical protein n=1 Tax=Cryptosporangium sp. NPDC051539 TaxID=3363962 RepID=UPI0037A9960D